jgi:IS5 family transposase
MEPPPFTVSDALECGGPHPEAKLREHVEHPFHVVKSRFGYRKVPYRGLKKHTGQHYMLFAPADPVIADKTLLARYRGGLSAKRTDRETQRSDRADLTKSAANRRQNPPRT